MKKNYFLSFIFLIIVIQNSNSQTNALQKANKQFEKFEYIDAIATYECIAAKGYKSEELYRNLGNAYYFNADYSNAAKNYESLFKISSKIEKEYYIRYSQSLKSIGEYKKANEILEQFVSLNKSDLRGILFNNNKNYLEIIKQNSYRYLLKNASFNSEFSDYGSAIVNSEVVFASARDSANFSNKKHKWTNSNFTNLYSAPIVTDSTFGKPQKFAKKINSKFHESTPIFTKDGKTMYFTRNNFNKGKKGKNDENIVLLKIYKSNFINNKWTDAEELPFNSNNYSIAHPALSPDEKTLYFASNMPGSIGQSDLYKVAINDDGTFEQPKNLGKKINTEGKETFPFVSDNNELYFASDGHLGLGALDIFVTTMKLNGDCTKIKNIGEPANSPFDDFAFTINTKTNIGFMTSNRHGGKGSDDIYYFIEKNKICNQILDGIVLEQKTGNLLSNSKVTLFDTDFNILETTQSSEEGKFEFEINCGTIYYVRAEKENYNSNETLIEIPNTSGVTNTQIELNKNLLPITVGDDLAKIFNIKIIHFDLDKSFIREDAAYELEKILSVLQQYPNMEIEINSHTDCRAPFKYNEDLSMRRAKETFNWLVKNGIASKRLSYNGFGERKLVNNCADGINCTEEEHQANRRSEFIIKKL